MNTLNIIVTSKTHRAWIKANVSFDMFTKGRKLMRKVVPMMPIYNSYDTKHDAY